MFWLIVKLTKERIEQVYARIKYTHISFLGQPEEKILGNCNLWTTRSVLVSAFWVQFYYYYYFV